MTLERIDPRDYRLLGPCEYVDLYEIGEDPSLYSPVEPRIQPLGLPVEKSEAVERDPRRATFERLLEKLSGCYGTFLVAKDSVSKLCAILTTLYGLNIIITLIHLPLAKQLLI